MPLLIDCYNVLRDTMPPMLAGLDEGGLCEALGRTPWLYGGVTIVADGRPKPLRATESPVEGIELLYAGASRTADDLIIELIDASTAPRRLTVVSSDREIRAAAGRRRAKSWTSDQFIVKLAAMLRRRPSQRAPRRRAKPDMGQLPPDVVDAWLEEFGYPPEAEPNRPPPPREINEDDLDSELDGIWPPD